MLYLINDEHQDEYWESKTSKLGMFERPKSWPARRPLTRILAWVLMPNHFHLLLEETRASGVAKFMQRLCGSMSAHFNAKYEEKGTLFQGGYKGKTISEDRHLRQIIPYIMVKNVFELYPGGYAKAVKEFDRAWQWGVNEYPFSSLPAYIRKSDFPIVEKGIIKEIFPTIGKFKSHAREMITNRKNIPDFLQRVSFEEDRREW